MSLPLFLVDTLPGGGAYQLDGPEGHHAATVQRLRPGESLLLGDGRGCLSAGDRGERCSNAFGALFRGGASGEVEDPVGELGAGSLDAVPVEPQDGQHGERETLVAVDE